MVADESELTLCIALADGVTARDIACDVSAKGSVSISRRRRWPDRPGWWQASCLTQLQAAYGRWKGAF